MNYCILVITSSFDYTVDYIIDRYEKVPFYRLNVDMINHYSVSVTNTGWEISSSSGIISEKDVKAIYYRKPVLPDLNSLQTAYRAMAANDIISMVVGILDAFSGRVLSQPSVLKKAENKTFQLLTLKKCGLTFPISIIGNVSHMEDMLTASHKIIKPLTTGKIDHGNTYEIFQTSLLNKKIEEISLTPVYIQNYIEKAYEVRVTYLNRRTWPVKIESSDKIDWRTNTAINRYSICELPATVEKSCHQAMEMLNLKFGAFDFIVNPQGQWFFLEVNPNGQWLWLEQELNLDISKQIVDYLNGG